MMLGKNFADQWFRGGSSEGENGGLKRPRGVKCTERLATTLAEVLAMVTEGVNKCN